MADPETPQPGTDRRSRRSERGFEWFLFFSDAVAAIAISLLILPLVDVVTSDDSVGAGELFSKHAGQLGAFALSFAVIARYWTWHHQLFETVTGYTDVIVWVNMVWLASIVFMPLSTEVLAQSRNDDRAAHALYIGTIIVTSTAMTALNLAIRRSPEIRNDAPPLQVEAATTVLLLVALVISVAVPVLGMLPLLLLILTRPVRLGIERLRRSRT